jgi:tRNA pseudouridine65 synthase
MQIIYEDTFCLIVNKPSNLLVHHSHFARNIEEQSLVELLKQSGVETPIPIHRLDRKTSGLLLFSKSKEYVAAFQSLFEANQISKKYWALLRGHVDSIGLIDSPVKNERGNYKEAQTAYRCLARFVRDFNIPPYPQQRYSIVEFTPKTGRYHQLRIHANKIAHPIINDPKHGNRHHNHFFEKELQIYSLFLHARELQFEHPFLHKIIHLEVEVPTHWNLFYQDKEFIDAFDCTIQ